jgi:hypothetical protein
MAYRCGMTWCHGAVTNNDWRRPDIWRPEARDAGRFSPFLNRRIAQELALQFCKKIDALTVIRRGVSA